MAARAQDDALAHSLTANGYYAATAGPPAPRYPRLAGRTECDVAVLGGGFAGLSAALELAERGLDVVLLDARAIGSGASGRNGGQALSGLSCDMSTVAGQLGVPAARRVWGMTMEAVRMIHERCAKYSIDAEWRGGYLSLATCAKRGAELTGWLKEMRVRSPPPPPPAPPCATAVRSHLVQEYQEAVETVLSLTLADLGCTLEAFVAECEVALKTASESDAPFARRQREVRWILIDYVSF